MVNIPTHILEYILCRLPVKTLKRFRCVAKPWLNLIDSEVFVNLHLDMSLRTMSHRHLIVRHVNNVFDVDWAYDDLVKAKVSVIKPPFPNRMTRILNSCNGLFLVEGEQLILWNPFTLEFKYLPGIGVDDRPVCSRYFSYPSYGLAYDSKNDDYKVVRVVTCRDTHLNVWIPSQAHIYSLKSNSWKQIDEIFTYPVKNWHANINGALHSLVFECTSPKDPGYTKIWAFSVEREKHYDMELPSGISTGRGVDLALHKIEERLCLIRATVESDTEVWVMKDYMVRESWTKMLSTSRLTLAELDSGAMKPLAITKDGHKVIFYSGYVNKFVRHDFRKRKLEFLTIEGLPYDNVEACADIEDIFDIVACFRIEACVETESLVLLHGEQQAQKQGQVHDDKDEKQDNKKSMKKREDFLSIGFKLVL